MSKIFFLIFILENTDNTPKMYLKSNNVLERKIPTIVKILHQAFPLIRMQWYEIYLIEQTFIFVSLVSKVIPLSNLKVKACHSVNCSVNLNSREHEHPDPKTLRKQTYSPRLRVLTNIYFVEGVILEGVSGCIYTRILWGWGEGLSSGLLRKTWSLKIVAISLRVSKEVPNLLLSKNSIGIRCSAYYCIAENPTNTKQR